MIKLSQIKTAAFGIFRKGRENVGKKVSEATQETYGKGLNTLGVYMRVKVSNMGKRIVNKPFKMTDDFFAICGQKYCILKPKEIDIIAKEKGYTEKNLDFLQAMIEKANNSGHINEARLSNDIQFMNRAKENNMTVSQFYEKEFPEESNVVMELFEKIENPRSGHFMFVTNHKKSGLSMADIKKGFDICGNDPRKLEVLTEIETDIRTTCMKSPEISHRYENMDEKLRPKDKNDYFVMKSDEQVRRFINSPNAAEYIEHYGKYKSFIKRNADNENYIDMLENSVKNGTVETGIKLSKLEDVMREMPNTEGFAPKTFLPYYSEPGNRVLANLNTIFKPLEKSAPENISKEYLRMYKTTTPQNGTFREKFIAMFYMNTHNNATKALAEDEVTNLNKLFEYLEENKDAKGFVTTSMNSCCGDNSAMFGCANDYLEFFSTYNSKDILANAKGLIDSIKAQPNKEAGYAAAIDYMGRITAPKGPDFGGFFKNLFGKSSVSEAITPVSEEPLKPLAKTITPVSRKNPLPKDYLAKSNAQMLADLINDTPPNTAIGKKLKLTKESVTPVLNKYIKSDRIMDEQERVYAEKATKIRASMLPDIFESIKVTRAEARAANGGKLPENFVTNEDAVQLYTRINGRNKKLVKYMLKQTKVNEEGKTVRAFTVNDIVNTLGEANQKIVTEKVTTAKGKKEVYDGIYDELTGQYGEPQKALRAKKASK